MARRYLMIGAPVTSVRTPRMLEERFAAAGLSARVEAVHLEPHELAGFMASVRDDLSVDGLMVTMPHKRAIIAYLSDISSTAALIGSINAAKRLAGNGLAGAQFDGVALLRALEVAGHDPREKKVLQFGFGGAGKAIAHALLARGCNRLAVHDAAMDGKEITAELERLAGRRVFATALPDSEADILINATPLGMNEDDPSPFRESQVASAECIADIVAAPPETRLAELAREKGVMLVTGRDLVAAQIDPIFDWLQGAGAGQ